MGWYRIKRRVGGSPIPEFYDQKVKELNKLKQQEKEKEEEIKRTKPVRYADLHGQSITGAV